LQRPDRELPLSGYFALGSFAHKYRSTVLAFPSALLEAQSQASQAAQVQAVLASDEHMEPRTASLVTLGQYPTSVKASNIQRVAFPDVLIQPAQPAPRRSANDLPLTGLVSSPEPGRAPGL